MRVPFNGFCGPAGTLPNPIQDCEDTYNWYPVKQDTGTPKVSDWGLDPTPGLTPFVALSSGPMRAIWSQGQGSRCFAVSGIFLYELFGSQTAILRGQVASDANLATISCNGFEDGHQLFITSGGLGYIYDLDADTLTAIADSSFTSREPFSMGEFSSSYFMALTADSNQFLYSALLDGTDWSGLDIARTSLTTDNKLALVANHADLWLLGTQRSEIWQNTGDANTPFQPIPGTIIEAGITAKWSAKRIDNTILWLGGDERGANIVWAANGYTPTRVSTFAIENYLNALPRTDDAVAWTYQQAGHAFYNLYCPSADATLVYDVATGQWHKRAIWNDLRIAWEPDIPIVHAYAFGKHLVGDRRIGMVYEMSLDFHDYTVAVP